MSKDIADRLNKISRLNLRGVCGENEWREVIEDYFTDRPHSSGDDQCDSQCDSDCSFSDVDSDLGVSDTEAAENTTEPHDSATYTTGPSTAAGTATGGLQGEPAESESVPLEEPDCGRARVPESEGDGDDQDACDAPSLPPVVVDAGQSLLEAAGVSSYTTDDQDKELEKATAFRCGCKLSEGGCCTQFSTEKKVFFRMEMCELTTEEKDLVILAKISCHINQSEETCSTRKKTQKKRQHQRTDYYVDGKRVCREMFKFVHVISQDKLTALIKWYRTHGLCPRRKKSGGRIVNKRVLAFTDFQHIVDFILNYAEDNAIVLPGRVPAFKRTDIRLLPSTDTKSSVWRKYKQAMVAAGYRAAACSTFRKVWAKLVPHVVIVKPRSDLCWVCQQNNDAIYRSANLPECVKSAKLRKQEEHLRVVSLERSLYQDMVDRCKKSVQEGVVQRCGQIIEAHYSFDYAQQIHVPSDPMQPGPMYFLVPRKVGIFGVCCEGMPQQVNYLIDESHSTGKGSNAVISYLHHYFSTYALGEETAHLHCDNCSGQNKNRFMLWYLAWRVMTDLHKEITLNFLITGHTKFAPDWCFGLFKRKFRRTPVSCLQDVAETVRNSTEVSGVNIPQLVGSESSQVYVHTYDWQAFFQPHFRPLPGIKSYHHFHFKSDIPGRVVIKVHADTEESTFVLLKKGHHHPRGMPDIIPSPGLSYDRQKYLYDNIRDFCRPETQDLMCPRPVVSEESSASRN